MVPVTEYSPSLHASFTVLLPSTGHLLPPGHGVHALFARAVPSGSHLPAAHALHPVCPSSVSSNLPEGHAGHDVIVPVGEEYLPGSHGILVVSVLADDRGHFDPARHFPHVAESLTPAADQRPFVQGLHDLC